MNKGTAIGTVGGTILSTVHTFNLDDLGRTVVLGMVGATVSFFMSMFLKWIVGLARSKLKK